MRLTNESRAARVARDGGRRAVWRAAAAAWLGGAICAAAMGENRVTITGGVDPTGQQYAWTVHNHSDQRIVEVVIPHYHADLFLTPNNEFWKQECTNLMQAGATDAPGVCRGYVEDARRGIAPNMSGEFGMRIARVGAPRRAGQVTVKFADGSQVVVDGVELPTEPGFGEQYVMAIGMFLILAIVVLGQLRKRRAQPPVQPT